MLMVQQRQSLGKPAEDPQVHDIAPQLREAALKMGANIITYALSR